MKPIATLIMAAGASSRFGQCKQLMRVTDKPLLQHSIDLAQAICPGKVFAVSGAWHDELTEATKNGTINNVQLIYNPGWADGLGRSIARGVDCLPPHVEGVLILLADQIAIKKEDLIRLRSHFNGGNIVCGLYAGKRGVPAIFGRNSFPRLKALQGDHGAKALLYDQHIPVVESPLEHAIIDIDTPEDLRKWAMKRDASYERKTQRYCA